jgi:hypothetical protein
MHNKKLFLTLLLALTLGGAFASSSALAWDHSGWHRHYHSWHHWRPGPYWGGRFYHGSCERIVRREHCDFGGCSVSTYRRWVC